MDSVIHNAIKSGVNPHHLVNVRGSKDKRTRYYFFFKQEVDVGRHEWVQVHHAIPNKGMIFDYIVGQHYKTLKEWAEANHHTVDDIMYGLNDDRLAFALHDVLDALHPDWVNITEDTETVVELKMDSVIHNAIESGANPHRLVKVHGSRDFRTRYYFFFKQEKASPSRDGVVSMHHAIPNKGMIFDYIVGQNYKTLKEWAEANNHTVDDIMYGVNDGSRAVTLYDVLDALHPNWMNIADETVNTTMLGKTKSSIRDAVQVIEYQLKRIQHLCDSL